MTPDHVPPYSTREQGCTVAEWLRTLPGAVGRHPLTITGEGRARVAIGSGRLDLSWQPLEPRRIALMRMPRMQLTLEFDGVDAAARHAFMRYFDLYLQRGGG